MSTARRAVLVLALVAAMTVALAGVASADPPPQAHPSCFGTSESADQGRGGPGAGIHVIASEAGKAGTTDELATTLVQPLQQASHGVCQADFP
jgi:hypothetical protein